MITFNVLKAFEIADTVSVSGQDLVEGAIPSYLEYSSQSFIEVTTGATLEDYFLHELASYGNQLGVMSGTGLVLVSRDDLPTLDSQDTCSNLDADDPEKNESQPTPNPYRD